jgi:hypothetical protein
VAARIADEPHPAATKRRKAGMSCENLLIRDESGGAVQPAFLAVHRNPLAPLMADA